MYRMNWIQDWSVTWSCMLQAMPMYVFHILKIFKCDYSDLQIYNMLINADALISLIFYN